MTSRIVTLCQNCITKFLLGIIIFYKIGKISMNIHEKKYNFSLSMVFFCFVISNCYLDWVNKFQYEFVKRPNIIPSQYLFNALLINSIITLLNRSLIIYKFRSIFACLLTKIKYSINLLNQKKYLTKIWNK